MCYLNGPHDLYLEKIELPVIWRGMSEIKDYIFCFSICFNIYILTIHVNCVHFHLRCTYNDVAFLFK